MRTMLCTLAASFLLSFPARADEPKLTDYFPPPESKGGWRSLSAGQG